MTEQSQHIESGESLKVLSALAFLETSRQQNSRKDRLEFFVPLFKRVIATFGLSSFSLQDMQNQLTSQSGLVFPPTVTQTILSRCCKDEMLKRSGGAYHVIHPEQVSHSESHESGTLQKDLDQLLEAAETYVAEKGIVISRDELMDQLVQYLDSTFSDAVLEEERSVNQDELSRDNIWPYFTVERVLPDSTYNATFESLIRGCIVYNAVFFPGFTSTPSFDNCIVFIDSPLLCMALGISSLEKEKYVQETIALLREVGIICRVLEPTVEEVRGILYSMEKNMGVFAPNENPESFSRCAKRRGMTLNDVFELRNSLETIIEEDLNLTIVATHERKARFVGNEEKLAKRLADKDDPSSTWGKRVTHDVNCIAEIQTLREGRTPKSLKNCKAVMVSSSRRTIRNIKNWWVYDEGHSLDTIPPMLSLEALANYVWLNNPSLNINSIHNELILITCATALSPSPTIWKGCVERLRQLVKSDTMTEERAAAILYNSDIDSLLCRAEQNQQTNHASINYDKTIQEAVQDMAKPLLESQQNQFTQTIKALETKNELKEEQAQKEAEQARQTINELEEQIKADETSQAARLQSLEKKCIRISWVLSLGAYGVVITIIFIMLWNLTNGFSDDGSFTHGWIIEFVFSLFGLASFIFTLLALPKWLASKLFTWLSK